MEKIQERALKFNENHSTYEELLAKSKLPSLKFRRIRKIAIETFKIINKEIPQYLHDLITLKNNKYNVRYSNTAHIPTVKTTWYGLNSFKYYASKPLMPLQLLCVILNYFPIFLLCFKFFF